MKKLLVLLFAIALSCTLSLAQVPAANEKPAETTKAEKKEAKKEAKAEKKQAKHKAKKAKKEAKAEKKEAEKKTAEPAR